MKKIFVLLFALMSGIISFAQSLEVKGVETKLVIYDDQKYEYWKDEAYYPSYSTLWFGFSFYNMNSIPVSVEAELYYGADLVDTKTFCLASKETYIWKQKHNSNFRVYVSSDWSSFDGKKEVPASYSDDGDIKGPTYHVKYKAYKIL